MIKEEYFKNLEKKVKYLGCTQKDILDAVSLAREVAKYTDDEKKVTRICNSLRRNGVHSIDSLMEVDLDEISKVKNIGPDAINILRQIRGLPIKTYSDAHPFAKTYAVRFCESIDNPTMFWNKEFNTLRELYKYFKSFDPSKHICIINISEINKRGVNA